MQILNPPNTLYNHVRLLDTSFRKEETMFALIPLIQKFQGPVKHHIRAGFKAPSLTCIQHVRSQHCGDVCISTGELLLLCSISSSGCLQDVHIASRRVQVRGGGGVSGSSTFALGLIRRMATMQSTGAPGGNTRD